MKYTHLVVHYSEIGLKGKNRPFFENALVLNIREALGRAGGVKRIFGRILVTLDEKDVAEELAKKVGNVFGVSSISPAVVIEANIEHIKKVASELLGEHREEKSFRVLTKRSSKQFPLSSLQMNEQVGSYLVQVHGKFVDLVDADVSLWIELVDQKAILYTEKIEGLRGLPVGVSGKVVVMLSGGIDSPVAAWLAMKRGCKPIFVHFHSYPQTNQASIEKVKELTEALHQHFPHARLYLVPFLDIQKEIMLKTEKAYRIILYRRAMVRIASIIAQRENAKALFTGENLAQVASQTIESMGAIENASSFPIFRPLLCYDKQEIVALAERIGTYAISIRPHEDCCTVFLPPHPVIKAEVGFARNEEEKVKLQPLIMKAIDDAEVVRIGSTSTPETGTH